MTDKSNEAPKGPPTTRPPGRLVRDSAPTGHHTSTLESGGEGSGQGSEQSGGGASSSGGNSQSGNENTGSDES